MVRSKLAKEIHEQVWLSCINNNWKQFKKKVNVSITAYYNGKRIHDSDNICSKLYIDGLVKSNIIEDDDTRYVGKVTTEAKIGQKENKVVICVNA